MLKLEAVSRMAGFNTEPESCELDVNRAMRVKYLDWLNGYNNGLPVEYERCRNQGHRPKGRKIGNCAYEYHCPVCNISYKIDSSG